MRRDTVHASVDRSQTHRTEAGRLIEGEILEEANIE